MIGDGDCQPECNVAECAWDGLDCGCAPMCNIADYGICKDECLVPDCKYDALPGFPHCRDEQMRVSFKLMQGMMQTFSASFDFSKVCFPYSQDCSFSLWRDSYTACVPECADDRICFGSYGNCEEDCSSLPGCISCSAGDCYECNASYLSFSLRCVLACPLTFEPHPLVPDLCTPVADTSTVAEPSVLYVACETIGRAVGSAEEPLSSLSLALAAAHTRFVRIYLMKGVHKLAVEVQSEFLKIMQGEEFQRPAQQEEINVEITALYCSQSNHVFCVNEDFAIVQLLNESPALFTVHGNFTFSGIHFVGNSSLVAGCTSEMCTYCPTVTFNSGKYYDDRLIEVATGAFAQTELCELFQSFAFITAAENATITFDSVKFSDFRQQFGSLISFTTATLIISNTVFTNLQFQISVIVQLGNSVQGQLSVQHSTIELLNNGFEYSSRVFTGFLSLQSMKSILIRSTEFRYNFIGASAALLSFRNFLSLSVSNCIFTLNFGQLITITSNFLIPKSLDAANHLVYYGIDHIDIADSTFLNNSGNALILISFEGELLNIAVRNCTLRDNLSMVSGLIQLKNQLPLSKLAVFERESAVLVGAVRVTVTYPKSTVKVWSVTFQDCGVYGSGLLSIQNFANVNISHLHMLQCGDIAPTHTFFEVTLKSYLAHPVVYMNRPVAGLIELPCSGLLMLNTISVLSVSDTALEENACKGGAVGIVASAISVIAEFTALQLLNNTSESTSFGYVLDVSALSPVSFSSLSVVLNRAPSGIVKISAPLAEVKRGIFQQNVSPGDGALCCNGICSVQQSAFLNNSATGTSAAALVYRPLPNASDLVLSNVTFEDNAAVAGGALSIDDDLANPAVTSVTVTSSSFIRNRSQRSGSCILILPTVVLSFTSLISHSVFRSNTAASACIYTSFLNGSLSIASSEFTSNCGQRTSVLYSTAASINPQPSLSIRGTLFEGNAGSALISLDSFNGYALSENLVVRCNRGVGIVLRKASWLDRGSVFYNNSVDTTGAAFALTTIARLEAAGSIFRENTAKNTGAAVYCGGNSIAIFTNCSFVGNTATGAGGAMFFDQQSQTAMYSCEFRGNKAAFDGAAIYYFLGSRLVPQLLVNCTFQENESRSGTLSITASNVTLLGCTITNNRAAESPGLLIYLSDVFVINSLFSSQTADTGALILAPASAAILLRNSVFRQATATARGAGVTVSSSSLEVVGCEFYGLSAREGAALAVFSFSALRVESTVFRSIQTSAVRAGIVRLQSSQASLSNSQFFDYENGAIVAEASSISIDSCEFRSGLYAQGAGINCFDCERIDVFHSRFVELRALSAAAIYLVASSAIAPYHVDDCSFVANRGRHGGAISIFGAGAYIGNSQFVNNSAGDWETPTGAGGALFLSCTLPTLCNVSISQCSFSQNHATSTGGAVYWTGVKPSITDSTFSNNSAIYGNDTASFAVKLAPASLAAYHLAGIPSGQLSPHNISLALFDHYDQIVATDNSTLVELLPMFPNYTRVTGITRVTARMGIIEFSAYEITHAPGNNTYIKAYTAGMLGGPPMEVDIEVSMRECVAGETLIVNSCYMCPEGKYSLHPSQPCTECPVGGVCLGLANIITRSGYWRAAAKSTRFWRCPNTDACLGTPLNGSSAYLIGECAEGYSGNLCDGCMQGFSRTIRSHCARCPQRSLNILRAVGVGVIFVLIALVIIKTSLISAHRVRSQYSVYIKIFVNYLQLVMLTVAMDLSWPQYLLDVFRAQESAGNISEYLFSFECFLQEPTSQAQKKFVYLRAILISFLPLAILAVSCVFWGAVALWKHRWDFLKYQMVNSLIVLFFIAHPAIAKLMFDLFNCRELEAGEYWLSSYLNIRCWDEEHTLHALAVALPSIILWGVATPATALAFLIISRKQLDHLEARIRFGFLCTGFQKHEFYWEFVILYRKIMIIVFVVFFSTVSVPVQALCVMLVLVVAFVLQMNRRPYLNPAHNELEQRSILVAAITIYCGLFFLTAELDAKPELALFTLIIAANIYFLAYWVLKTCQICLGCCTKWLMSVTARLRSREIVFPANTSRESPVPFQQRSRHRQTQPPSSDMSHEDLPEFELEVPSHMLQGSSSVIGPTNSRVTLDYE